MKSQSDRTNASIPFQFLKWASESSRVKILFQLSSIGLLWAIAPAAQAQVPISGLGTSYQQGTPTTINTTGASPSNGGYTSNAAFTLNFGSTTANDRTIQTFDTGTGATLKRYNFGGLVSNIYIRRNEANFPGTNRQLGFFERSSPTSIISSYAPDMETILRSQTINRGTDNTFANQGNASGNNSNIERLDFVNTAGLTAPADATQINDIGFLILERNGNDSVKIAAITSIDATGRPTGYGTVVTQTIANWGPSGISLDYAVMRRDATDPDWRPSDSGIQRIAGIYFSFGSLGVTAGQTIYGYSIIPADVTATTGVGLTDWLQYPTTTPDTGTTGIDLMAGGGVFVTHTIKGTVFSDPNGSKIQDGTEVGVSGGLKAVLLDAAGVVIQVQTVTADGSYKFTSVATPVAGSPYTVLVTTITPALGSSNPVITLPAGYVSTGENKKNTIDAAVDTKVAVTINDFINLASQPLITEATGINFGIEQLPTAVTTTTPGQANPGGTTSVAVPITAFNTSTDPDGTVDRYRITAFPTNATSIEIDGVIYTVTAQPGTTAFPTTGGVTVLATKLNTIKVDPIDGAVNVTIPFKAIDNAGQESANTANAVLPFTQALSTVSGTVFNDVSGNQLKEGTEPIINGSTLALNAVLFDVTANKVFAVTQVSATGTYTFGNVVPGNYTVILTTATAAVSGPIPTVTLPTNWTTTGENLSGTVETTPAIPDSKIAITVAAANITNLNFGIEQLPTAIGGTATSQPNPTGTNSVSVPTNLFNTSTDPDTGTVDNYRITALPTNATSIEIGGLVYTATAQPGTIAFPAAGVTVLATKLNTIKVDPIDGAVNVTIPFKAIDNAGKESTTTANAIVPFGASLVSVSGSVFDDGNGNKLQATPEIAVNGTTLGLKAVLVNNNQVIATVAISTTGTYTFNGVVPGNYSVLITTNTPVGTTVPAIALPTNWITTGENLGGIVENTPDSQQLITVGSTAITGVNFGIEQLPTAIGATATPQPNPRNTVSVDVPPALFNTSTDNDGTVDQYRITSFPSNATSITIDGTVYTLVAGPGTTAFPIAGVTIPVAKLNTIQVDPNIDGAVDVTILFKAIDNFGKESTNTGNAIVPFTAGNTPELILLKRITKINGLTTGKTLTGAPIDLTTVIAQPDNPATPRNESGDASNTNWPTTTYPQGAIDAGAIKSGDTIEYTIYFLSGGKAPVTNANFCDWVPKNTTFVPDSYGLGRGIQLAIGSLLNTFTNVPDTDRGVFYNPGAIPPATYPDANTFKLNCMSPAGTEGAVVVNLVNNTLTSPNNQLPNATAAGTPGNSYGFVRFVSKVR